MSFNSTDFVLTGNINSPTYAAVLSIEGVIGIIANVAVLLMTLYQRKSWNQPSTIFFTSLLLSNLIIALVYFMSSIAVGAEEWIFGKSFEEKNGSCMFVGYALGYGGMLISATLAVISFDWFLFIVKPHLHKQFMRPRVAVILIIVGAEEWIFGNTFEEKNGSCMFVGYILWYGGMIIAATLATISFDRFLFIVKPHLHKRFMRPRVALILIIVVWKKQGCSMVVATCFIKRQGRLVDRGVYQSKSKRLFGIFGSMLLFYIIALLPSYIVGLSIFFDLPDGLYAFGFWSYGLVTTINPLIQSYFRPEVKATLVLIANKIGLKSNKIGTSQNHS
uniref:G-protein coupled receptors family 1 profile domain-containing protein n=1 Tax=Amphimedon queenslandica TaxID=400682 RepID=A0A1X7VVF2_AMPQE